MIVIPIYLTVDTDNVDIARSVADGVDGVPSTAHVSGMKIADLTIRLVSHRGECPVLLTHDPAIEVRTYLPVPGRKISS